MNQIISYKIVCKSTNYNVVVTNKRYPVIFFKIVLKTNLFFLRKKSNILKETLGPKVRQNNM